MQKQQDIACGSGGACIHLQGAAFGRADQTIDQRSCKLGCRITTTAIHKQNLHATRAHRLQRRQCGDDISRFVERRNNNR